MKVYNEAKTQELKEYDLTKGYLKEDKIIIRTNEAQKEIKEVSHEEIVAEYPNGGKDVKIVIDTPYQPAKEAWEEYENIQVYIPFSQEELDQRKLRDLENWFETYFEKQMFQSTWQQNFKISYDKYFKIGYNNIEELKAKAEEVRAEIKQLKQTH